MSWKKHRKNKTFSIAIEKEVTEIDKDGNESVVTISYKSISISCFLGYESAKDNLIKYKCQSCNKDYSNNLDEEWKKRFKNILKFFNNVNRFMLLRNGA